jgi:hypothetical protein
MGGEDPSLDGCDFGNQTNKKNEWKRKKGGRKVLQTR